MIAYIGCGNAPRIWLNMAPVEKLTSAERSQEMSAATSCDSPTRRFQAPEERRGRHKPAPPAVRS